MSLENVELVQNALERFGTTGEPPWDLLHEEIEVRDHDIMDAGEYRGHTGFARWIEDWATAWSEYSMEPEKFIDADARVVVLIRQTTTGKGSGVVLERQDAMVFEVCDGKVLRLDYYNNREQAFEHARLAG